MYKNYNNKIKNLEEFIGQIDEINTKVKIEAIEKDIGTCDKLLKDVTGRSNYIDNILINKKAFEEIREEIEDLKRIIGERKNYIEKCMNEIGNYELEQEIEQEKNEDIIVKLNEIRKKYNTDVIKN